MHLIEVHHGINLITATFDRLGFWAENNGRNDKKLEWKKIYLCFAILLCVWLVTGAFLSDKTEAIIFLAAETIVAAVLTLKLFYINSKKDDILQLISQIGAHSIENDKEFMRVSNKIKLFMKFAFWFSLMIFVEVIVTLILPLLLDDTVLPLGIPFPQNWDRKLFCVAFVFVVIVCTLLAFTFLFSIVIWYLMLNCCLKYEILGDNFKNMGGAIETADKIKISKTEKQNLFHNNLIALMDDHQAIDKTIENFKLCFSYLFFVQMASSAACICGSIHVITFSSSDHILELLLYVGLLVYSLFDIFMVMYLGNDIQLARNRLSYCLFECDWIEQSPKSKKMIIILTEVLNQPWALVIYKLYPMNLETFTAILNCAYSMFNILQNLKKS